jgi:hypothetical protein
LNRADLHALGPDAPDRVFVDISGERIAFERGRTWLLQNVRTGRREEVVAPPPDAWLHGLDERNYAVGTHVAFRVDPAGDELVLVAPDGSIEARRLVGELYPDHLVTGRNIGVALGNRIVFSDATSRPDASSIVLHQGLHEVTRIVLAGRRYRTFGGIDAVVPCPSGLVAAVIHRFSSHLVTLVDLRDGAVRDFVFPSPIVAGAWSPSGRAVAFLTEREVIHVLDSGLGLPLEAVSLEEPPRLPPQDLGLLHCPRCLSEAVTHPAPEQCVCLTCRNEWSDGPAGVR